jgi:hypothetical protein
MKPSRIILIRHAEKPTNHGHPLNGVLEDGTADAESLTVRGWQRAGALAAFLASPEAVLEPIGLERPDHIFASGHRKQGMAGEVFGSHSRRPVQTVTPLALRIGLPIVDDLLKGEEQALVQRVLTLSGTVLVCWQHELIPQIGGVIAGHEAGVPALWPDEDYDPIWIFIAQNGGWSFQQTAFSLDRPLSDPQ